MVLDSCSMFGIYFIKDYNFMDQVAAGVDLEQLKDNIKTMKETIDNERKKIDQIFSERSQLSKKIRK